MNSESLFKETIKRIVDEIKVKKPDTTNIMEQIDDAMNRKELHNACKVLHDFIESNVNEDIVKRICPNAKEYYEKKIKEKIALGYSYCYAKDAPSICKDCEHINNGGYAYRGKDSKNDEIGKSALNHFLTRLLYEWANNTGCPLYRVREKGMFIIALEIIMEGKEDDNIKTLKNYSIEEIELKKKCAEALITIKNLISNV